MDNRAFSRRNFIRNGSLATAGFIVAPGRFAGRADFTPGDVLGYTISDKLYPCERVIMKGFIGRKLDESYEHRILAQPIDDLLEPFRHRTETHLWQTEFWGKWFTSAVLAYRYRPEPGLMKILDKAVQGLLMTQTADGYIGNYKKESRLEQWDIWGTKYCLLGLLDYHELTGDRVSLAAAAKLADNLINEINSRDGIIANKGNYRGMAACSVLESIARLYMATHDKKYLDFAEAIPAQWEKPGNAQLISKAQVNVRERFPKPTDWYSWEQGQKAYEMMSCYEGLLELYRITGNPVYKNAVTDTWENIRNTEINIAGSGASGEMWFGGKELQTTPVYHFQETCVTVTWIRFNQTLLRLTGDVKYAEAIEESYYNALLGAVNAEGSDWAKYTPLNGQRLPGSGQCGMRLNCCVASGPRGQFSLPRTTVMSTAQGLSVNFFVEGSYTLKTPSGKQLMVHQKTDYPVSGMAEINFTLDLPEVMTVRIRIPGWSRQTILQVNHEKLMQPLPGQYLELNRTWTSTDKILLQLDMRGRIMLHGKDPVYAAVLKGPMLLARDSRLPATDLGVTITPVGDAEGYISLVPSDKKKEDVWMEYDAPFLPEAYSETGPRPLQMTLCDYASAGNGNQASTFQVWMPQLYDPHKH